MNQITPVQFFPAKRPSPPPARSLQVVSPFEPNGDQPTAIVELTAGVRAGERDQVLLGATGTGKTFTMAKVIEETQRPAIILAPNKTLAAQLYGEFKGFFPDNAVEYFVSYYDYYQPEAYVPQTDTFIEKDSSINEEVERLRHSATNALLTRRDVIVVATVSCIYGLGTPEEYIEQMVTLRRGAEMDRDVLLRRFVQMQYVRNDVDFHRGTFRVRGDTVEIIPMYEELAVRIEFFGDEIESIQTLHPLTGQVVREEEEMYIFPASHYVAGDERMGRAITTIEDELRERLQELESQDRLLEAQRLRMRTTYDLEMMQQMGYCNGIENYSRHIDGRPAGSAPHCLLDYFPDDFLLVVDESHVTIPQIGAMYEGDMSRKRTLVEHGFRLPSAMDNRPLKWDEFLERIGQTVYLSATPGAYELGQADGYVEQIIRPTGLVDPEVIVKPVKGQIDDLIGEIRKRTERDERVLVTTLTKKMSEDLTDYLLDAGIRTRYLHSEVDTLKRIELLRDDQDATAGMLASGAVIGAVTSQDEPVAGCTVVPLGLFFGRVANFINGELWGRPAPDWLPWAMVFPHAGPEPRHPSQLYQAGLEGLALFALLMALVWNPAIRARRGFVSGAFLAGYGAARFVGEFFRQPDAHLGFLFAGATMGQLLSVPMVLVGVWLMLRARPAPVPAAKAAR